MSSIPFPPAVLLIALTIVCAFGGCVAGMPTRRFPELSEIQTRLGLSDKDWDQIVGAVSEFEGLVIFDASSRTAGVVGINLIDTRKESTSGHPAIVVEERNGTWVVTTGPEAGLVWYGPYYSLIGPCF